MRNDEQRFLAGVAPGAKNASSRAEQSPPDQRVRGVAGQLRPYRELRAGFEPWRRAALLAWALREKAGTVH